MPTSKQPAIRMRVGGVVVDPTTKAPIVVLRGLDDPRLYLPIYIGGMEATAIATALANVELPRPMSHDLMASMLAELSVTVRRVTVTDLVDGTFYAEIALADHAGHPYTLDARPSDSIALALRTRAEIYVARPVLEEAGGVAEPDEPEEAEEAEDAPEAAEGEPGAAAADAGAPVPLLDTDVDLADLDPETFGKYKQ